MSEPSPEDYLDLALEQFNQGKFSDAAISFSKGLPCIEPADYERIWSAYGLSGLARYQIDEYSQAIADTGTALEAAVNKAPEDVVARLYYQRGMIQLATGNEVAKKSDFEKAYQYDPQRVLDPEN